jgi:ribonuclease HI
MAKQKNVIIYTDGACLGNPGPGGWAAVLIYGDKRKEASAGYRLTTNNRMEVLAAIEALNALNRSKQWNVQLYSDSIYLINTMTKGWLQKWEKSNWKRKSGPVLNVDLWIRLKEAVSHHKVEFHWVEGHVGNPENEVCDKLSKAAARNLNLLIDEEYEKIYKVKSS